MAALLTVLRYIVDVSDTPEQEILTVLERGMLPNAREALMTIAERLRTEGREQGRKEGRKEGREENQRDMLLKLLERRFGALPEPVMERIRGAGIKQLDRWFDRGITARSLRAVFADEP